MPQNGPDRQIEKGWFRRVISRWVSYKIERSIRDKGMNDFSEVEEQRDSSKLMEIGNRAATNAINENRALKLPLTYIKDGWVIREYPDGHIERIEKIKQPLTPSVKFKKGTVLHVKLH